MRILALFLATAGAMLALPFEVTVESGSRRASTGDQVPYDLYIPKAAPGQPPAPWPAVVLTHGFGRTKANMANDARYLAQRGFVVMTPNMVNLFTEASQVRNIANTAEHVAWLILRARTPGDALSGLVDPARISLAGFSAGGAVTFEAAIEARAANLPVLAVVLLDAVPWSRTVQRAAQFPTLPMSALRAEPSACNAQGALLTLLQQIPRPSLDVRVVNSSHCDAENPSDFLCRLFCNGLQADRSAVYQRLLHLFLRDVSRAPEVAGDQATYTSALLIYGLTGVVAPKPVNPATAP